MAFDAGFLSIVSKEIRDELSHARLERIFQCTHDTFVLEFRAAKKPRNLFLSAGPSGGCCYLTKRKIAHPDVPPMFCMLLRKHLSGGRFLSAEQIGFERVLRIAIEFVDAFGSPVLRTLYLEAMGRFSNLILCDENDVILGALRTSDLSRNPDRPLLVGMKYTAPLPRAGTVSLFDDSLKAHVKAAFSNADGDAFSKDVILRSVSGIAPVVAAEMVFRTCGDVSGTVCETSVDLLLVQLDSLKERLSRGEVSCAAVLAPGEYAKRVVAFSYLELLQFGNCEVKKFESPCALLDSVTGAREERERLQGRVERASSTLRFAQRRLRKKLEAQLCDLESARDCDRNKLYGDLITQEIWRIRRGDRRLVAVDYETQREVEVLLDTRLSPSQNAQRYYKQYQKQKRALSAISAQIEETREELAYAESISESIASVSTFEEADQICTEVSAWGYGRRFSQNKQSATRKTNPKKQTALRVTGLVSPNGFTVLCGKNNLQNEEITFRLASKLDLWFHAKGRPGPHVVLRLEGDREPADEDLLYAARLAVPSSCVTVGCEVDYTRVKSVKRHPSGLPGRVVYTGEKTVFARK